MVKIKKSEEKILDVKEKEKIEKQEEVISDHNVVLKDFLNRIEIEDAIVYKNLRLFAVKIKDGVSNTKLKTLTEALQENIIEIKETSVVANLQFINKSKDSKIIICEGEIVKGGRQNRVINVTMILDEESETIVPTSCVEQGRWSYTGGTSTNFDSVLYASPTLQEDLSKSVNINMRSSRESGNIMYCSNQSSTWSTVSHFSSSLGVSSNSQDYTKIYEDREKDINDYYNKLKDHFKDCAGIIAIIGKKLVFSIADSKEMFMPQFEKLLKSYIIDALIVKEKIKLTIEEVAKYIDMLTNVKNEIYDSPNKIGKIIKIMSDKVTASAFLYNDSIVHLNGVEEI